jgi:hypothetical protein
VSAVSAYCRRANANNPVAVLEMGIWRLEWMVPTRRFLQTGIGILCSPLRIGNQGRMNLRSKSLLMNPTQWP